MQFVDLEQQQSRIKNQLDYNIQKVLSHGNYIMGPEVKELENLLAKHVGVKHAIGCASGTDALLLALMAYNVGPGDAIFTTPFTFIATAEVISLLGATPIFVDIDTKTFNIDPEKLELAIKALKFKDSSIYPLPQASIPNPQSCRGIIPVDLFGLTADYNEINSIAKKHNLFVVEDAAQSFGAEYHGKKSCSLADIGCTSFFPAKPLGCYGDGGMCFTDDDEKAEILRSLLVHGKGSHKYDNERIGINGRLDTLQAAILLAKFGIFSEEIELRNNVARYYNELFSDLNLQLSIPSVPSDMKSVWAQYSILARDENHRSEIQEKLKTEGIPTAIYYPKSLHLQTAFKMLGYNKGDFPVSEDSVKRIFSLPMHPYLTKEEQEKIVTTIKSI
jgi:UDP-2-acetamido-2-deoxy-ribo-hexuluronate aminotransferase